MEKEIEEKATEKNEEFKKNFRHKLSTPITNIGTFIAYCERVTVDDKAFKTLREMAEKEYNKILKMF
ncbi:MAG: hypothetical protein HQM16_05815 [Deltaproteobacteria bacterium]|nr:hypothetical protein [Deltaproteobacteria bacterium]